MSWQAHIRPANGVLSAVLLTCFMLHGVGNAFQIMGVGSPTSKALAFVTLLLAIVHGVAGIALTIADLLSQSARRGPATGERPPSHDDQRDFGPKPKAYALRNARFWAVRASGLAVAALIAFHMATFLQVGGGGAYRLRLFGEAQLVQSVLLVAALAVHVLANARPLMVSLGVLPPRMRAWDLCLVAAAMLVLMAVGFVVYYLRWSVV